MGIEVTEQIGNSLSRRWRSSRQHRMLRPRKPELDTQQQRHWHHHGDEREHEYCFGPHDSSRLPGQRIARSPGFPLGNLFIVAGEPEVNNGCVTSPAWWHPLLDRSEKRCSKVHRRYPRTRRARRAPVASFRGIRRAAGCRPARDTRRRSRQERQHGCGAAACPRGTADGGGHRPPARPARHRPPAPAGAVQVLPLTAAVPSGLPGRLRRGLPRDLPACGRTARAPRPPRWAGESCT